jgi:flagellar biosynthesis/type III secretory pathway protein FliH
MAEKFNFVEFSTNNAVKTLKSSTAIDEKIRDVIVDHLDTILNNDVTTEIEEETAITHEITHHSQAIFSENQIEDIKKISYDKGYKTGYEEAKSKYESQVAESNNHDLLLKTVSGKLLEFLPVKEPISDYVDLISAFLEDLSEKLAVSLPTNFASIIKKQLSHILNSGYVEGKITIRVNQKNLPIIEKIIKNEEIASKFTNIEVIPDIGLPESDCVVDYNESKLVYDKSLVKSEIDEIIRQFKQDSL